MMLSTSAQNHTRAAIEKMTYLACQKLPTEFVANIVLATEAAMTSQQLNDCRTLLQLQPRRRRAARARVGVDRTLSARDSEVRAAQHRLESHYVDLTQFDSFSSIFTTLYGDHSALDLFIAASCLKGSLHQSSRVVKKHKARFAELPSKIASRYKPLQEDEHNAFERFCYLSAGEFPSNRYPLLEYFTRFRRIRGHMVGDRKSQDRFAASISMRRYKGSYIAKARWLLNQPMQRVEGPPSEVPVSPNTYIPTVEKLSDIELAEKAARLKRRCVYDAVLEVASPYYSSTQRSNLGIK